MRRDRLITEYFDKGFSNNLILCFLAGRHGITISLSTLKRCLCRLKLKRRSDYSDFRHVGDLLLRELEFSASLLGYRAMHQRLKRKYGLRIPRDIVAEMMKTVDPVSVLLRSKHRLIRRSYWAKIYMECALEEQSLCTLRCGIS